MALGTGHWVWVWVWVWRKAHNKAIFKTRVVSRIAHHGSPISHLSSLITHLASAPSGAGNELRTGGVPIATPWGNLFY